MPQITNRPTEAGKANWLRFGFLLGLLVLGLAALIVSGPAAAEEDVVELAPDTVRGVVWDDANGNGLREADESLLDGINVQLQALVELSGDSAAEPVWRTVARDETRTTAGRYEFAHVPDGLYYVQFGRPVGSVLTKRDASDDTKDSDVDRSSGRTVAFSVVRQSGNGYEWDAGFVSRGTISGSVWLDTDANGWRVLEPGTPGVKVELLRFTGGVVSTQFTQTALAPNGEYSGRYEFKDVPPGDYQVRFSAPPGFGFTQTRDADAKWGGGSDVSMSVFQQDFEINARRQPSVADQQTGESPLLALGSDDLLVRAKASAGLVRVFNVPVTSGEGAIGDYVWIDENDDGIQGDNEPSVDQIAVDLLSAVDGQRLQSTHSDAEGHYGFHGLPPGPYILRFTPPSRHTFTAPDRSLASVDSDVNPFTWQTEVLILRAGRVDMDVDAGLVPGGSISDLVWLDVNPQDGLQNEDEVGVSGISLTLQRQDEDGRWLSGTTRSTTTDSFGRYAFDGLPSGTYKVIANMAELVTRSRGVTDADVGDDDGRDSDFIRFEKTAQTKSITIDGDAISHIDLGLTDAKGGPGTDRLRGAIAGIVWDDDDDGDGWRASSEGGIHGVRVVLQRVVEDDPDTEVVDRGHEFVGRTLTDTNGQYQFNLLPPGNYSVTVVPWGRWQFSPRDADVADRYDSDVNWFGWTGPFALGPGTLVKMDAGLTWDPHASRSTSVPVGPASITVFVWSDRDHDGVQNDGPDSGVEDVVVRLVGVDGPSVDRVYEDTTNIDGYAKFSLVTPGWYEIEIGSSERFELTKLDVGDDRRDSDVSDSTRRSHRFRVLGGDLIETVDAGLFELFGTITGLVWRDEGGQLGVQDRGEPIMELVDVELIRRDGSRVHVTSTGVDGRYGFRDVPNGDYQVRFLVPRGGVFTAMDVGGDDAKDSDAHQSFGLTNLITIAGGSEHHHVDAGITFGPGTYRYQTDASGSFEVFVWSDDDASGTQDQGEAGLPNVEVALYREGKSFPIVAAVTATDGLLVFRGLAAGDYYLEVVPPQGYTLSHSGAGDNSGADSDIDPGAGRSRTIHLKVGERIDYIDAGLFVPNQISGIVWDDDGDGIREPGEPGRKKVTVDVVLLDGSDVARVETDAEGRYEVRKLPPGEYRVRVWAPEDQVFSPMDQGVTPGGDAVDSDVDSEGMSKAIPFDDTGLSETVDAGLHPQSHSSLDFGTSPIRGHAWIDWNSNGLRDVGEPARSDVVVRLLDEQGNELASQVTLDAAAGQALAGAYAFLDVPAGRYQIAVEGPNGPLTLTAANVGFDAHDSDFNPASGRTAIFEYDGREAIVADVGVMPDTAQVRGLVWREQVVDGVRGGGEAGIGGVTVLLLDAQNQIVSQTVTDASGGYLFEVSPGRYQVRFVANSTMRWTLAGRGDGDRNSDVESATGMTEWIVIEAGTTVVLDAGAVQLIDSSPHGEWEFADGPPPSGGTDIAELVAA